MSPLFTPLSARLQEEFRSPETSFPIEMFDEPILIVFECYIPSTGSLSVNHLQRETKRQRLSNLFFRLLDYSPIRRIISRSVLLVSSTRNERTNRWKKSWTQKKKMFDRKIIKHNVTSQCTNNSNGAEQFSFSYFSVFSSSILCLRSSSLRANGDDLVKRLCVQSHQHDNDIDCSTSAWTINKIKQVIL